MYVSGTKTGSYNGTPYTSLANWKTGSSQDANSIAVTAPFTSTTDLHLNDPLLTSLLLNAGTDLSPTVTTDFDGDLRRSGCGGTDIGADEVYLYSTLSSSSHVWLGKVGTNWCDPCNWENQTTPSSSNNVIIQTSVFGNNPVVTTGCVANSKNLTINSASLSVQTGGTLNIYGNFTNASTFTNTGGDVNFAGSTSQTITSTSALSFYNLNFSGGGAKSINFNATVNGTLGLSSGVVTVSSGKYLALAAGAVYTGGGSSSYINGTLRKYFSAADNGTIFRFPVGDATRYGPIELANITNAASGDYMDGSYTTGAFSGNHRNILTPVPASPTNSVLPVVFSSYVEYWNLNFSGGSSFAAKLNLYYTSNLYSQLFNKGADWLRVTRFDGTGVLDYGNDNPLADQASGSSGYISSAGLIGASAFNNIFTFGTTANGVNPLPSYFKSFTATKQTGYNKLDWNVGCNGKELTFDILRSTDGRNFQSINKFTASQSRCSQPFDFNDYTAIGQKIYYRIRITDEYGKIIYTPVAVIINRNKGFEITGLMPNPASDVVFLNISSAIKDKLQLSVTDVNGKQVISLSAVLEAGSNTVSLQVSSLAKGVYNISGIYSDGRTAALRFIKQ